MKEEGLLAGIPLPEDAQFEAGLRPRNLDEFIGQEPLKERLRIVIEAAQARGEPLDHVILSGPPGLGKTTLAGIIANSMEAQFRITSGPALERPGDLAAVITNLDQGDVLFIDEIHRLPRTVEEVLYPALEDFALDIVVGKGPAARSIRLDLPRFTLVGATTRIGRVSSPLRDRFGFVDRLGYYEDDDLRRIVERSAALIGVETTAGGAGLIAGRSRGTPRIANRLLRRVRDYAAVRGDGLIDDASADLGLKAFEVDEAGLDRVDRAVLLAVVEKFGGGPVGLTTLAIAVGEEPESLEDAYEPFLLQRGFLKRTPRGRVATDSAYRHLGLAPPEAGQPTLM